MRKHKIPLNKVQEAFNSAIRRRDMRCRIQNHDPCDGELECSHFFTVGSSPSLRFYPLNAYTQCAKHHRAHHNSTEPFYRKYLIESRLDDLLYMEVARHRYIKYTDEMKAEIIKLCKEDRLDELQSLIEGVLGK